jgi:putative ABC transport system permease protein
MPEESISRRVYRWLLKLYPAGFRETYEEPMEQGFREELAESTGLRALAAFWMRQLADLAVTVPGQVGREFAQDARHTFRLWLVRPWQTACAVFALAIGIGANMGMFSVVNALLLGSLPFRQPESLASFQLFFPPHDSPKGFHEWRSKTALLDDAALWATGDANLGGAGEWRRARVAQTSWNFFALLGVDPVLGRTFAADEEVAGNGWGTPGPNAVAVISYGLWQSLFSGDHGVLGATIRIDGNALTVIGVAPPGFDYPEKASIWKPAAYSEGNYGFTTVGRLKKGISWDQARALTVAEADRISPRQKGSPNPALPGVTPLRDELAGPAKNASLVLMGGAVLILFIACLNVANLLTARTADRHMEMAIRSALGASRARLVQQLLTECFLLALAGGAVGASIAYAVVSVAAELQPAALATQTYSMWNGRVIGFAIATMLLAGFLFGILPALYARQVPAFGARSASEDKGSRRLRGVLVAAQVTLTIVLVSASISLGRAFLDLMQADRGFDRAGVVTAMVSVEGTTHEEPAKSLAYFQEALDRLGRLPGVQAASTTQFLPLDAKGFMGGRYRFDGRRASMSSMSVPVMQDYFRVMGNRLLAGREFTGTDVRGNENLVIVNDVFAREFGQPAELIGHKLSAGKSSWEIIGVVKAMDYMVAGAQTSQVFHPSRSPGWPRTAVVVRVAGRPEDRFAVIRDTIRSVDPQVPLFDVKTLEQRMADEFARPQFYKTAVMCFAGFAFLLAIFGLYSIVSYSVARAMRGIGVRMALGARPAGLRASLLFKGLLPVGLGVVLGVAGAVLSGKLLEGLVQGAKLLNATAWAAEILFIGAVASAAIWAATRPIARLDVMEILRIE